MNDPNQQPDMPLTYTETLSGGLTLEMIWVEGGSFVMGGRDEEAGRREQPLREVKVPGFYMGKYPVTQGVWKAVMGADNNPTRFRADERPVEQVSWDDAQKFMRALKAQTGRAYRLPSEAEWEYAARGGQWSEGYVYAGSDKLAEVGWYRKNSGGETHAVGQLLPNELGLYDLSGNVWEWCEDDWHGEYEGAPADGSAWVDAPERGIRRVLRGGSWNSYPFDCRVANRYRSAPFNRNDNGGFRVIRRP